METQTDRKAIEVFVRKGERENLRLLSVRFPADVPARDLLAAGYALDGNSAKRVVPLDGLHAAEVALQDLADRLGWDLAFK